MAGGRRLGIAFDVVVLLGVVLVVWQLLFQFAGSIAISSPLRTIARAGALLADPTFWPHLGESALAVGQGLAIAVAVGIAAGILIGVHRLSGEVAEPILVALYSIPKITLYPIILLFFGTGMPAKVAFGAIHGVVPIILFTMNAMRNISPAFLRTARVMRLTPWQTARHVLYPAAMPEIFTGLRVGFALTLVGTLMGEMFGSQRGLGYLLMIGMGQHDMLSIMSITLLLVAFSTVVSIALLAIDNRLRRHTR
ncbi:MAG: ABC transporter permease subunit [Hyphomicrobiaceae bacterium]